MMIMGYLASDDMRHEARWWGVADRRLRVGAASWSLSTLSFEHCPLEHQNYGLAGRLPTAARIAAVGGSVGRSSSSSSNGGGYLTVSTFPSLSPTAVRSILPHLRGCTSKRHSFLPINRQYLRWHNSTDMSNEWSKAQLANRNHDGTTKRTAEQQEPDSSKLSHKNGTNHHHVCQ